MLYTGPETLHKFPFHIPSGVSAWTFAASMALLTLHFLMELVLFADDVIIYRPIHYSDPRRDLHFQGRRPPLVNY